VETRHIEDPGRFLQLAGGLLSVDEARHNLIFGLAATLRDDPGSYPSWHLWLVEDGSRPVGAALQTPPLNLVIARPADERAHGVLARAILADGLALPGVTGAVPEVDRFGAVWTQLTGVAAAAGLEQRIYSLSRLRAAREVPGVTQVATLADVELLHSWIAAFGSEIPAAGVADAEAVERVVLGRLGRPEAGFVLWKVDGDAVSLAGWSGPTPNGIRIGPVYTPPAHRRHGYASALVAELSRRQLAAGRRFCFLYTDAANPTSNRIYVNLGYEHVCDSRVLTFGPAV
jgi:uncharacterized protein